MTPDSARDIGQFPLLSGLEDAVRQRAARSLRWQHFASGAIVIDRDEEQADVHFLARGQLLAVYWTRDGREIIFTSMSEGNYFGELTALDGVPRSLCVYARTAAELAIMPAAVFRELIRDSGLFRDRVLAGLTHRVRDLTERMCQLTSLSVPDRVKAFVLRRAVQADCLRPGAVLRDFPTHAEIAAQIGANREAVSRALSAMRQDGILRAGRGEIIIADPDGLLDQDL
ncbi:Crp/Fnr family transcriptional regulator [Paracoccus sp. TOH]|uniref:Crp/Fnr family transcriptional regulator n=1 Tax=Paracoccus sp. TOH TaxID=1263728 RepID=UPI0025B034C6|nr:Crp/Fnr family transcriptional regulator [Paracoccus sp. TOH]WJS87390.1 Crp/Fnr family transcriptional regulator [Paracoccus sp. TOH]